MSERRKPAWLFPLLAIGMALLVTTVILILAGASPFEVYYELIMGAVGYSYSIPNVLVAWAPLALTTAGLLITFSAGLWNIGVEGQITLGAIFTTGAIRLLLDTGLPPALILIFGILAGILGGSLWAMLVGLLKTFGGVNEIFAGLGMNFVATTLTLWLIFGPWKRPGTGSMSGTEMFPESLYLPRFAGTRLSLWALGLAVVALVAVYFLLRGTYFGLRLKMVGKNPRAAALMGIPTWRYTMSAFVLCGSLAGLTGALQVTAVYYHLIPSISSNYGFMGLLVAMLVNYQALWVAPVALFFSALNIGSIELSTLQLDSSLAGVLQGALVLSVMLMDGLRRRWLRKS